MDKIKKIYIDLVNNPDRLLNIAALFVVVFSLLLTLPALLVPLGLPPEGDAMDYRIPLLRWILRHGTFPNWDWTMIDDYPMVAEFLMLPFHALHPALARLVPILAYTGLGACAGGFMLWLGRDQKIITARTLFFLGMAWALTLRPLEIQANLLMIDNIASFFLLASLLLLTKERIIQAGVMAALAAGTRYTVWPSVFVLPIFIVWAGWGKNSAAEFLKKIFLFGSIALLGALPFMLRNYFVNGGNPFFPIGSKTDWSSAVANYGRGTDLVSFLLFPFDLLYTNSFVRGFYDYTVGKLFYVQLLAVLPFCFSGLRDFIKHKKVQFLFAFSFLHLVIWFFSSQQLRFLVPAIVIWVILILAFLMEKKAYLVLALVTLLGIFSTLSIQKDSILIALFNKEYPVKADRIAATNCFASVERELGTDAIGYIHRDGVIGFFDRDFIYIKGSSFAIDTPSNRNPAWIYMNANMRDKDIPGFVLYPPGAPCIYKKI